jgi:hypothetical protein
MLTISSRILRAAVFLLALPNVVWAQVNHAPVAVDSGSLSTAVRFDGSGDELRRTTSLPPITGFTTMGWFRVAGDNHAYSTMMGLGANSGEAYLTQMCCGNGWRQLQVWTGSGLYVGSSLALGTWYHVATTVGAGQVKVYLNGVLDITGSTNPNVVAQRLTIGNDIYGGWFDGNAANVKVYDAALTQAEIAQEMGQSAPVRTSGLNSWYPLQSVADAGTDYGPNGRAATVLGALTTDIVLSGNVPTTLEDTPVTGYLPASDSDGDSLTYSIISNGSKGIVTITNASTGAFTYSPNLNANGIDSFTFSVSDGALTSNAATTLVVITPVNDAPVAANTATSISSGDAVTGTLVTNDVDSSALTYSIVANATKGVVAINPATGAYTYTSNRGSSGTDTFSFRASDGNLNSNTATVSVAIGPPVNHPPVAISSGTVMSAVRFDGNGDELRRTTNLPPITGFTMMGWFRILDDNHSYSTMLGLGHPSSSNGYLALMCCGNGWRQLMAWNGRGLVAGSNLALGTWYHVAMTVSGTGGGQFKVYLNGALDITFDGSPDITPERMSLGNDSHNEWLDGNAANVKIYDAVLTQSEIAQEMTGAAPVRTASLNSWYPIQSATDANIDYSGNGRTLTISGALTTDMIVTGTVPSIVENTSLTGTLQASDFDGDPITYALVGNGTKGFATITNPATGAFTYTPNANTSGIDSFTFTASDGTRTSNVAQIMVIVAPVNHPPAATDGTAAVLAGSTTTGTLVASDVDNPPSLKYTLVANGTKGTATITNTAIGAYSYRANVGTSGTDTFTFRANDGLLNSNIATVTVTITPPPPPVNHAPVAISMGQVVPSVRLDAAGDSLTRGTNLPPITGFTMMGWFRVVGDNHSYSAFLSYGNASSSDSYVVEMCCGNGWRQLSAWNNAGAPFGSYLTLGTWYHIAMTVGGTGPGQFKVYLNGQLDMTANGNANIPGQRFWVGNDAHDEWLDGNAASVKIYDAVLNQAEINQEMLQSTPVRTANLNAWYPLQSAADAATDYSGNARPLTILGNLTSDMAIGAGTPTTHQNTPVSGTLQATDSDGDPLSYSVVTGAANGVVTITNAATGAFTYTPNTGFTGTDSFTFTVTDGALSSNVAKVTILITP